MSYLVTFPDGYDTLCSTREAAEKMLSYWGHIKPTIRDLDQEAKDREEMIDLLLRYVNADTLDEVDAVDPSAIPLLKRLGRLP